MIRAAALVVLLLALPGAAGAAPRTLVVPTLFGEYHLTYDDARIGENEVRAIVPLSPHLAGWTSLAVAPRLERCVVGEPGYLDCRPRATDSSGFLFNARINLDAGAAALRRLSDYRAPAELETVITWLQRSMAFSLWLEETKFEFYRSRDIGALRRRYEDVETAGGCAPVLSEVTRASSREAQDDLVVLRWHNCVNELVRSRLGAYPLEAWRSFLATRGITEKIIEKLK
jgi:hypothetical protein